MHTAIIVFLCDTDLIASQLSMTFANAKHFISNTLLTPRNAEILSLQSNHQLGQPILDSQHMSSIIVSNTPETN